MKSLDELKRHYSDLKTQADEIRSHINDLAHGHVHIHIAGIDIDYDVPEDLKSYHHWLNRIYIWVAASLLGLGAVGFSHISDMASEWQKDLFASNPAIFFLLMPFGLVLIRWMTMTFFKGSEGSGIPQVIASLQAPNSSVNSQLLSIRAGIGKVIGTTMGLMIGASIGREGPTVQFGAIILARFSRWLKAPILYTEKSFILAGGAAGVSAAFNTPIAGIIFAIEELGKSFYEKETSVLLMAIVVSGLTALSISGDYYYFGSNSDALLGAEKLYSVPVGIFCGVIGGLLSSMVCRSVKVMQTFRPGKLFAYTFTFGLLLAAIGYLTEGATLGSGYSEARKFLESDVGISVYPVLKLVSTYFSYLCGIPGGVFSPTLSIGAGFGSWFAEWFSSNHYEAFTLLGMVSFFSGVVRAPITSVIIVSEMTHNHVLLFPLLLASLAAYGASKAVSGESLYKRLAQFYLSPLNLPKEPPKSTH